MKNNYNILKKIIRSKIKDNNALKILDTIIDTTDELYINEVIAKIKHQEIDKLKNSNCSNKDELIKEVKKYIHSF